MRTLRIFIAMAMTVACARAADVKISDLTIKTDVSTNTFVEVADMSDTPKSGKALFYDLLEDFLVDSDDFDFSTASGLRSGNIKPTAEIYVSKMSIDHELAMTNLTASRVLVSGATKQVTNSVTTAAEIAHVSGVTSAIQTQLDSKASTAALSAAQNGSASLTNIAALGGNGLVAQTGASTFANRTVTGTANQVAIANGDGASGNPTASLPAAIVAPGSLAVTSTLTHNGADSWKILTNSYAGFNVFLDLATNSMQFLSVTNNFTLIPTNMAAGQRVSLTLFNPTATNITITHTAGIQFYGSSASNVVVASKRLKSAWESQDAAITNVSAAFAAQKN